MSSHQGPYYYSDPSLFYESDSSSPVARQSHSPGPSWIPSIPSGQSGYAHPHQSLDQVGNLLEASHAEDAHYPYDQRHHDYSPQAIPFQDPSPRTDATYDDNIRFDFADLPFYPCSDFDNGHSQLQRSRTTYEPIQEFPGQALIDRQHATNSLTHDFGVHHAQDALPPQTSQDPPAPVYQYSSPTLLLSLDRGGPVYGVDMRYAPAPTEGSSAATAIGPSDADTELHSHLPAVGTSTSHNIPSGPSRPVPGSPERKRLFPSTAAEELSPARRVAPRTDRAWSVHSTPSDSHRHSPGTDALGRGPFIPQDRYRTSSISSYTMAEHYPHITFDLENPDQAGVSISDILNKTGGYNRIRDRTRAFDHMGKKTFTLRLKWPGYKPWSKTIAALDWTKSRAPITRVKLAEAVATAIRDMLQKRRDEPCDSDCVEWNIGPNGIQLDQLCLVALYHVSKGSWQPQLCLLQPRQH